MAEEKFTRADLEYIYRDILGHDTRAKKDVDKLMKKLPAQFTLADLQKVTPKGISDSAFQGALGYMQQAVQAAPAMQQQAPASQQTLPAANATAGRSMAPTQGTTPQTGGTSGVTSSTPVGQNDRLAEYMPGQGLATQSLQDRFLGMGPGGFASPPTYAENYMQNRLQNFQPTGASQLEQYLAGQLGQGPTAPSGVEQLLAGRMAQGPTAPSPAEQLLLRQMQQGPLPVSGLEQLLGGYAARGPQGLTPGASQFEQMLGTQAQNPFLASLARGEIPPAMQQALNANLALSRAGSLESQNMGGALASSDLAEGLARAENDARLNFLASMQGQAGNAAGILGQLAGAGGGLANQRMGIGASLFPALTGQGLGAEQARQGLDLQRLLGTGSQLLGGEQARQGLDLQRLLGTGSQLLGAQQNRQGLDLQRGLGYGAQLLGSEQNRRATDINRDLGFATPLLQTQGNVSENAMNRYLGTGGALSSLDAANRQNALGMAYQDYLRGLGLPPEVAALLGLAGLGGGTTKSTGSAKTSGGQGWDLLAAAMGAAGQAASGFGY